MERPKIISPVVTTVMRLSPLHSGEIMPGGPVRIIDRHSSYYPIPVGEDKWILIDGGVDKKGRGLVKFMEERNLDPEDFLAGFISHAHSDHVGGFNLLRNMPIYVGEADYDVIVGKKRSQGLIPRLADYWPGYLGAMIPDLVPRIMVDDQVLEIGSSTIRGIAIEGHTDGSMGHLVENHETGITIFHAGDAFDHGMFGGIRLPPRPVSAHKKLSRDAIYRATDRIIGLDKEPIVITSHSGHRSFKSMKKYSNMDHVKNLVR